MAALAPLATLAGLAVTGLQVARTLTAAQQRQDDRQTQVAVIDTRAQQQAAQAEQEVARVREAEAIEDRRRTDALRRSVASRRAALSGQGVGAGEGSGEALLLGLVDDSALDKAEAHRLNDRRVAEIASDLDYRQRLNLLERARAEGNRTLDALDTVHALL